MLSVALRRLQSRVGLSILSLVSMVLVVGLVVSIPVFSQAASYRMFQQELTRHGALSPRPPFSLRIYVTPSARYKISLEECARLAHQIAETISSGTKLPVVSTDYYVETMGSVLRTGGQASAYGAPHTFLSNIKLAVLPQATAHVRIVEGASLSDLQNDAGPEMPVWLHRTMGQAAGIEPGERFEVHDPWRHVVLPVRIAGIWEADDPADPFWQLSPEENFHQALLVQPGPYQAMAEPQLQEQMGFVYWHLGLDGTQLRPERLEAHATGMQDTLAAIATFLPESEVDGFLPRALEGAVERKQKLTVLLYVISVPVIGFMLYFLVLVSTISIQWQQRETAVMVGRGMRREQLLIVALIEILFLVGVGLPVGLLAGLQIAQLLGQVKGFMTFTWRESLPTSITAANWPLVAAAVSAVVLARLAPIFRSLRTTIVAHERKRARTSKRPLWQRTYLDFLLLGVVGYAYRQLQSRGTLVPQVASGDTVLGQDPLLFLVPVLFSLAFCLLLVRVFPLLMWVGDWLGSLGRRVVPYLALRQLARQSNQYSRAILLVMTALSLGAFVASMAESLDHWMVDQVRYEIGADVLIVQMANPDPDMRGPATEGAWVLPSDSYLDVPGVVAATRVGSYPATVLLPGQTSLRGALIGLDRVTAPEVLFYRSDFAPRSLGALMNLLAQREDAVLVSALTMARGGYEVGDRIRVSATVADVPLTADYVIAGSYDYFPTVYESGEDETAVVANLDYVFQQVGATLLHDVWLRVEPAADREEMERAIRRMGVHAEDWLDVREEIASERAKGERLGLFGSLTIGFLAAALLAAIGLLLHNYATLQERLFRFTILRGIGVSLSQVIGQVTLEYVILMLYSVAGGLSVGVWASWLFIPFFQSADRNVLRPPTMVPRIAWQSIGWITASFMVALIAAQIVLLGAALRRGVFQALRMGDAE